MTSSFFKAGRWAYSEERQLIELMRRKVSAHDAALALRRSDESVAKKLGELGLAAKPAKEPSREQLRLAGEAAQHRERAARFRELAAHEQDDFVAGRLTAMAVEQDDKAMTLEARIKL